MPDYPKTTGELVTVKDPLDNKTKLLDTLIQLLRNADESTLKALNNLVATVSTLSAQAWKNNQTNLPESNNAYDIGSASQMIKSIYSMGMTLGREGYEWEINDTDGYITLPSGIVVQWKTREGISGSGEMSYTWTFTKDFTNACVWAFAVLVNSARTDANYQGYLLSLPTESSCTFGVWQSCAYLLFALGY